MELQPYLSFDDVCNLAIKNEKHLRVENPFKTLLKLPEGTHKGFSSHNKVDATPTAIKTLYRGKGITSEPPNMLEGKKCFKCYSYGHF